MNEIKFSCEHCVFAEYTSFKGKDIQYGCSLNRLIKLNPNNNYEEKDNLSFFVFNRFCNTMRPKHWLEEYCDNDIEKAKHDIWNEIAPRLSIIIKFDYNMDNFKATINSIDQQLASRKFIIVINDREEHNIEIFEHLEKLHKNEKIINYHILMPSSIEQNVYDNIDSALGFCKNGWIIFLDEGHILPLNATEKINHRVNEELRRLVYCSNNTNKSFVIQAAIYKLIGGNSPKILEDGTVDNRTFLERINQIQAEDPDCFLSWESLFNE